MLKNLKGPPFTVFGIVRFLCLKIRFSQAQHAMSDIYFFKDRCFLCDFFSNLFSSKLPSIFTRNETFCEHKGLLKVFGTAIYRRPSVQFFFEKCRIFFFFCFFLKKFSVFCCFQLEKNGFRDLCVSLRVFCGAVNLI